MHLIIPFRARLFLIPVMFLTGLAAAQPDRCWNPDVDADGRLGVLDLLALLGAMGEWEAPHCAVQSPAALAEPVPCDGVTTVRHEGHAYAVTSIGGRCWFAENLRSTRYTNGDAIPDGLDAFDWLSTVTGARAVYGEAGSRVYSGNPDPDWNLREHGRLYNWYAVDDWRGLCPPHWHVPTDDEWAALVEALGGMDAAAGQIHSHPFNPLPAGGRNYGGFYGSGGTSALWWSSTATGTLAWYWRADIGNPAFIHDRTNRKMGAAIRCIHDD